VLDALARQTRIDAIEIIIVDLAVEAVPRLTGVPAVPLTYLSRPGVRAWGAARADAVAAARAPIVAFIEDHCFPTPTWAERLIETHAGPWAAVGYAFTNANPATHVSRVAILARYGAFAHPAASGEARYVSGNNVSYKRDALLERGDRLGMLLDIDFNLQEDLIQGGGRLYVDARALAAHTNYTTLGAECRTGLPYCRLLAARRSAAGKWSWPRRVIYGVMAPVSAPVLRLARLARSLRGRRPLWAPFLRALPMIGVMYVSDAIGESAGYLAGAGDSERAVLKYELETDREP
jgi:hypothetical protein